MPEDREPLPSSRRRPVVRPLITPEETKELAPLKEIDLAPLFVCEAVEVAANALITSIVGGVAEPDLAHTGAIRQAVQLLHSIGEKPNKKRNYKEMRKLIDMLEAYHASAPGD